MSSNKLKYDTCTYKQDLKQSIKPINYMLDPIKYNHCNQCGPDVGIIGGTNVTHIKGNLVDLESDLMGRTRVATRCPEYEWNDLNQQKDNKTIIYSKEYTKLNKHAPINIEMSDNLRQCDIVHAKIAQVEEPKQEIYKCN